MPNPHFCHTFIHQYNSFVLSLNLYQHVSIYILTYLYISYEKVLFKSKIIMNQFKFSTIEVLPHTHRANNEKRYT